MNVNNINQDGDSDNQTVTQTENMQQPIVTLEYLLNENRMKQIALNKATHLIQLYKIQLQVKQQDYAKEIQNIKKSQKKNYQPIISQLQEKIVKLQRQIKHYQQRIKQIQNRPVQYPQMLNLNESGCRVPRLSRNNSNRDLSANRKGTKRYSHTKNTSNHQNNQLKRSLSTFVPGDMVKQQDLYRFEKTFVIEYLLKIQQKDEQIISSLQNQMLNQLQQMNQKVTSIKLNDKFIQQFIKQLREPFIEMENKMKELRQIIKIQQLVIEESQRQSSEYQTLFNVMTSSLHQIFSSQNDNRITDYNSSNFISNQGFMKTEKIFQEYNDIIEATQQTLIGKIRQYKAHLKQKITGMQAQNKELKRILDDMIKLIKTNRKLQVGGGGLATNNPSISIGNVKSHKNSEEYQQIKQKTKSNILYRN